MRSFRFFLFLGIGFLISCQSKSPSDAGQELPPGPNNFVEVPDILAALFSPNAGVFRGADFGMDLAAVMALDSAELVGSGEDAATYTLDFSDQEFADFRYEQDSAALSKIQVDIFAATPASAIHYHQKLTEYFDEKYRPRTENLWDGSEKGVAFTAFLKLLDQEKEPGVVIVWEAGGAPH